MRRAAIFSNIGRLFTNDHRVPPQKIVKIDFDTYAMIAKTSPCVGSNIREGIKKELTKSLPDDKSTPYVLEFSNEGGSFNGLEQFKDELVEALKVKDEEGKSLPTKITFDSVFNDFYAENYLHQISNQLCSLSRPPKVEITPSKLETTPLPSPRNGLTFHR